MIFSARIFLPASLLASQLDKHFWSLQLELYSITALFCIKILWNEYDPLPSVPWLDEPFSAVQRRGHCCVRSRTCSRRTTPTRQPGNAWRGASQTDSVWKRVGQWLGFVNKCIVLVILFCAFLSVHNFVNMYISI